jgi:hypothetical protein
MLMAACGVENPSATSSDDTHSIAQPANTEENIASAKVAPSSSDPTTNVIVESPSLKASTTSPQNKVMQNSATSVVKNSVTTTQNSTQISTETSTETSTTLPVVTVDNGSTPATSAAPSKTQPTPTIAPTCDVMPLADCQNVDLRGLDLYFANFQGANLAGAIMSGMDLTGIDFTDADLTGANLTGATLDYALFFNTTLTNAELRGVSMESIVWDDTTIWPAGFVPPDY